MRSDKYAKLLCCIKEAIAFCEVYSENGDITESILQQLYEMYKTLIENY